MEAILALEDGRVFRGRGYGAPGERFGEVVFNTSLSGYQEILTDPSYAGQIVILTYPHIGNYGTNSLDCEAARPYAEGLVVRELSELASNWRSEEDVSAFLAQYGVPIISDIDTRALVRHLRTHGAMRGVISTVDLDEASLVRQSQSLAEHGGAGPGQPRHDAHALRVDGTFGVTSRVSAEARPADALPRGGLRLRHQAEHPAEPGGRGLPGHRRAGDDSGAAMCSPSSPMACSSPTAPATPSPSSTPRGRSANLMGRVPIFGICLGHQIIGLALGGKTYKLKFGHHGGNHPVLNLETQKVEITAQNHGFAVDPDSLKSSEVVLTHTQPERRHAGRLAPPVAAALQRAVSPGGLARPARLGVLVRPVCENDGRVQEGRMKCEG